MVIGEAKDAVCQIVKIFLSIFGILVSSDRSYGKSIGMGGIMFKVVINQMDGIYGELQSQIRSFNSDISQLYGVVQTLGSLSGMEDVIASLKAKISKMEEEQEQLRQLMLGLSKTASCYRECENRSAEHCTQSTLWAVRSRMGYTSLEHIGDTLSQFHFS